MASSLADKYQSRNVNGCEIENAAVNRNAVDSEVDRVTKKFSYMCVRDSFPNSFHRSQNNHRHVYQEDVEEIESFFDKKFAFELPESEWRLPDVDKMFVSKRWELKEMMKMKAELNAVKNKLNDFELDSWRRHTKAMNKAGNVVRTVKNEINGEFVTQAWCKFYEICCSYNFIPELAREDKYLNSLHICEAPGAFITSLNHYLHLNYPELKWEWLASTLNPYYEGNPLPEMINEDRFIWHSLDHWNFGEDYTGNLMRYENLRHLVQDCKRLGPILMITADGSFDCQNNPGEQESSVYQLLFCEVVAALHILSGGGNFVVKMFTMYEAETICLMYLLVCCFESVNVYKPATSKEGNSENYVVCLNYDGVQETKAWLKKLITKFSSHTSSEIMFSLEDIPKDFLQQQIACAEKFKNYQIEVIERNIYLYKLQNNQQSVKKMKRLSFLVAQEYISRYQLRPISEGCQVVGENVLRLTETPNIDAKENVGSFNDLQEKQKVRGMEKLKILLNDLTRIQVSWKDEENIKWLEFDNYSNKFKIVVGKPVTSVLCSKFCMGKVLTLRNEIANIAKEMGYVNPSSEFVDSESELYSEELSSEIKKIIEKYNPPLLKKLKVLNYKEKLWVSLGSGRNESFERLAFFDIMGLIDSLWRDESFILQGYPMLTQFTAGVVYMIGHLFERVGFVRPVGQDFAVIFQNYRSWNVKMKNFLNVLDLKIEQLEDNKSVLAVIPLAEIVYGHDEFYKCVTTVNSLCVLEQNNEIIQQLMSNYNLMQVSPKEILTLNEVESGNIKKIRE